MAHEAQRQFLMQLKEQNQDRFKKPTVLDCGSLDINGNTRFLFDDPEYTGIDIGPGPNVDVVAEGGMHTWKTKAQFDMSRKGFSSALRFTFEPAFIER